MLYVYVNCAYELTAAVEVCVCVRACESAHSAEGGLFVFITLCFLVLSMSGAEIVAHSHSLLQSCCLNAAFLCLVMQNNHSQALQEFRFLLHTIIWFAESAKHPPQRLRHIRTYIINL